MLADLFALEPLNVLAERSRDLAGGYSTVRLMPSATFRVTENTAPITDRLLRKYDVVAICGTSAEPYSDVELKAIESFVRRGGSLILASCSGQFELYSGRSVGELVHNAVAARFGFRFESAQQFLPDVEAIRGMDRDRIEMTDAAAPTGLLIGDVWIGRPGPLSIPKGATVLLRDRHTGVAVMASATFGRGKVLVCNDLAMWAQHNAWVAGLWTAFIAPKSRVGRADRRPIDHIPVRYRKLVKDGIELRTGPSAHGRAKRVMELARAVRSEILRIVRPEKPPKTWSITVHAGGGSWGGWTGSDSAESHIGASLSDAMVVSELVSTYGVQVVWSRLGWGCRVLIWGAMVYLRARVMRKLGFRQEARMLEEAVAGGPSADLGRVYSESRALPITRRFWFDAERVLGADVLARAIGKMPKKEPLDSFDYSLFSELDMVAYYLALAFGPRVYAWLREHGHTVREMPLKQAGSKPQQKAMGEMLEQWVVKGEGRPTSERYDALMSLASRLRHDKVPLEKVAKQATSAKLAEALPAAARLAQVKDERGRDVLAAQLPAADSALAAVAALTLVFEYHDKAGADSLVELAEAQDLRFQLSAGYALKLMGDERAERYAFAKLPGCQVQRLDEAMIKSFPAVDGYEVANVWSMPMIRPGQCGAGYSVYYVQWVHTHPRWRRRGLARAGMDDCLDYHWDRECSMTSLHTGTRNVAHALYRDYGLIDYFRGMRFEKALRKEEIVKPPKRYRLRPASAADRPAAMSLVCEQMDKRPTERPQDGRWPDERIAFVALRGRETVGFVAATPRGDSASLDWLAVDQLKKRKGEDDPAAREQVGAALLSALHARLVAKKVKKIETGFWNPSGDANAYYLLRRGGYGSSLAGGVELYRINNLAQYLRETRPALERRLKDHKQWADWCGTICLSADDQHATLRLDRGTVAIGDALPSNGAAVHLKGDRAAIQRMVSGITSAFDEYYQIHVDAAPLMNDGTLDLLETLFPKLIAE